MGSVSPCPVTGCWWWMGGDDGHGRYGKTYLNGRKVSAHRVSFMIFRGPIATGLGVLHRCDQPACVNPNHLFLGTQRENVADMFTKRRDNHARGERVNTAKLTTEAVAEIRRLLQKVGETHRAIAERYGVRRATISKIARGENWAHGATPSASGSCSQSGS